MSADFVMISYMETTGDRLKKAREKVHLSMGQVAALENVHKSYVSKLESGKADPNVWELIAKLARRYGTSTDYLLGLTDNPAPVDNEREGSADLATQHHTITDAQRAILELLDQLPEDEQEFVIELIQFVIQRSTPRIIG